VLDVSEKLYDDLSKLGDAASNPPTTLCTLPRRSLSPGPFPRPITASTKRRSCIQQGGVFSPLDGTAAGSTKSCVVIDATAAAAGVTALSNGSYVLRSWRPTDGSLNIRPAQRESPTRRDKLNSSSINPAGADVTIRSRSTPPTTPSSITRKDILVNQTTTGVQTTTSTGLNVFGDPANTRSVAADHEGQFAVVWLQYGLGRHDRRLHAGLRQDGNPITNETAGKYLHDGDQTESFSGDGPGRRFRRGLGERRQDADGSWGVTRSGSTRSDRGWAASSASNTIVGNDQVSPAVAMDAHGDSSWSGLPRDKRYSYFNGVKGAILRQRRQQLGSRIRGQTRRTSPGHGTDGRKQQFCIRSVGMGDVGVSC